jgi:periplasmic divalent cation tolerance protein
MKTAKQYRVVLVTCGTLAEARRIARIVVGKRLAACVNVVLSPAESYYHWKGKLEKAREYLLIIKATSTRLTELESQVKSLHSYDMPEFIALPIVSGSRAYLGWLQKNVSTPHK